jgi:hypothetical protein
VSAYILTAGNGSYLVTGNAANLSRTYILGGDGGTYILTGNAVNLGYSGAFIAPNGFTSFVIVRNETGFIISSGITSINIIKTDTGIDLE